MRDGGPVFEVPGLKSVADTGLGQEGEGRQLR